MFSNYIFHFQVDLLLWCYNLLRIMGKHLNTKTQQAAVWLDSVHLPPNRWISLCGTPGILITRMSSLSRVRTGQSIEMPLTSWKLAHLDAERDRGIKQASHSESSIDLLFVNISNNNGLVIWKSIAWNALLMMWWEMPGSCSMMTAMKGPAPAPGPAPPTSSISH